MEAHAHYCLAEIAEAKSDFEGRVLKLAEKTSLKVSDIIGLEEEVKMMKVLFINLPKLGKAWKQFIDSGESAGFTLEIPEVECYSIPSMKSYVLQGAADLCGKGDEMLKKIKALQKNKEWRTIPVIVITAKELTAEDHKRLSGGVTTILRKGAYRRTELLALVQHALEKPVK